MHAAFEFAHVGGGREIFVTTTVFSTVKCLFQQRVKIDEQDKQDVLQLATWLIAYRARTGTTRGFQACIRWGHPSWMDGRVVLRLDAA